VCSWAGGRRSELRRCAGGGCDVKSLRISVAGLVLAVLVGGLAGAGAFTFQYGEGLSYFSTDPAACTNCHIMQPHYDTWLKSSHHAVATCVDCHLPADFPRNLSAKADNGLNHSWAFTFENFHEPIHSKPRNAVILQENCLRCHDELVHQMLAYIPGDPTGVVSCVHCHDHVGHTDPPR
jgi:cytochrome c nitrite reductase small subunit